MTSGHPELRLVCTDKGQHPSAMLAKVTFEVGANLMEPLIGPRLGDYLDGRGPHSGQPLTVNVTREWTRSGAKGPVHVRGKEEARPQPITRADGGRTWQFACPRCKRSQRLRDTTLSKIGASGASEFDLSYLPT